MAALHRLNILDTAPEAVFDALTELARSALDVPFAILSLVDAERQWFKSVQGLPVHETSRDASFCAHAILQPDTVLVVPDATQDDRFMDNPLVTGLPGIRFYAGAPLTDQDGHVLGTLCVISQQPRTVSGAEIQKLQQLAMATSAALHLHGCMQEMSRLALTDSLTGLVNRASFDAKLEAICATTQMGATTEAALLMFDLDGFKAINDLFGHPGGDRALREVASRLKLVTRSDDVVARLGGDEFAILCTGLDAREVALVLAQRVHTSLADTFMIDGQVVPLRTSIGIAEVPWSARDPGAIVAAADAALYVAKRVGGGATRLAGEREHRAEAVVPNVVGRQTLQALLRNSLCSPERSGLTLQFQPIVDLETHRVCAFEALTRWTLPDGRSVPPCEFVPIAEGSGLVAHLDRWVFERACATAVAWPTNWTVSVNLSTASVMLLNAASLVNETLARTGLAASRLRIEITETVPIMDTEQMARTVRELRALGVTMMVDDFGSGYASLAHLGHYAFNAVKIDQSLVTTLGRDVQGVAVIEGVVHMMRPLGLTVIAEGVETSEQFHLLRSAGVRIMQGYLLGRPVPHTQIKQSAQEAEAALRRLIKGEPHVPVLSVLMPEIRQHAG